MVYLDYNKLELSETLDIELRIVILVCITLMQGHRSKR